MLRVPSGDWRQAVTDAMYTVDALFGHQAQCGSWLCVQSRIASFDDAKALADQYEFANVWSDMGDRDCTWDNGRAVIVYRRSIGPLPEDYDAGAPWSLENLGCPED